MIGQVVNYRYEVLEKIGDGAFFAVYKARDKVLNRLVSLKVLGKEYTENREFAAAVAEGYQSSVPLAHPSIARVFEADSPDDQCFVACEYVRGISVKERVRRAGAMAVPLALDIIIPVVEALEYAHANGFYHGDIRPQDIIVSPDGEVKLTDFGMSWALDKCPAVADTHPMRSIHYQAPEIAEGAAPSAASDLYSVGVVLYEMVTSALPHDGTTAVSIALKKVKEPAAPPRSINAAVPKSLSDIILKAIEAAPNDRYESGASMLADMRAVRDAMRIGQPVGIGKPGAVTAQADHTAEEAAPEAAGRTIRKTYLALLGLFLGVVVIVGGITWYVVKPRGEILVPKLLGMTWEEAVDTAKEAGIELVDDGRMPSDVYKKGTVCSVIPPAGSTVPKDNPVVRVRLSSGASYVVVPDLKGVTEADAIDAAARAGFVIGKMKQQYSDDVPINCVISQDPEAGLRRPPNSAIDIVISQGPKPVQPPIEEPTTASTGEQRRFSVFVEVPEDAGSTQEVLIKVNDDRGERIEYKETRYPGDKFTVPIETQGRSARIRVYVGGSLVSDATY